MNVGRITFGPQSSFEEQLERKRLVEAARQASEIAWKAKPKDPFEGPQACCCVGPQPGETKCPCRLRAESRQGSRMVRDGVVIDGVEYDLVPKRRSARSAA